MHPAYAVAQPHLPEKPGVYRYYDQQDKIIYVGKAKNLKKRVSSYFTKDLIGGRLRLLVKSIDRIEYTIVDSEVDALLLENSLIKTHQPKFNVSLKDDKTYPYLCISNERFPKVFPVRRRGQDGAEYFGPFANVSLMKTVLEFVKQMYPLRTCNLNLSPQAIQKNQYRACLEAQIGNCLAPCEGRQTEEDYNKGMLEIREILRGNLTELSQLLQDRMRSASEQLEFERAHFYQKRLDLLKNYQRKSIVFGISRLSADVFSWKIQEGFAVLHFQTLKEGRIIFTQNFRIDYHELEEPEEPMAQVVLMLRDRYFDERKELILQDELPIYGLKYIIPQRGDRKKLVDLGLKNALYEASKILEDKTKIRKTEHAVLQKIQSDFNLKDLPMHMECFDNSNIQGTSPVSACVVFRNARPSKKDYRIFNIKTVEGPDDFASMKEGVFRRYRRMLDEGQSLPQLIVIDGGKGQLNAAHSALKELGIEKKLTLISIAKNLEELFFYGDTLPIYLDKRSVTLRTIQHMRDEAHRYGLQNHRKKRSKNSMKSVLDEIKGIGKQTKDLLLMKFGSIEGIKNAGIENLEPLIGKSKTTLIWTGISGYFDSQNQQE